jgi:hypothetical protein
LRLGLDVLPHCRDVSTYGRDGTPSVSSGIERFFNDGAALILIIAREIIGNYPMISIGHLSG